jgi:hypothetical protein
LTGAFDIRLKLFILSSRQFSRHILSPLGIEEAHVLAIDLLALFRCRIGSGNVEIAVLHEVVISIASARLSPACEPRVACRRRATALVVRWRVGLGLFDALFKIAGRLWLCPGRIQPPTGERKRSQHNECDQPPFNATVQQTVHTQDSPTDSSITRKKCGFLRAGIP